MFWTKTCAELVSLLPCDFKVSHKILRRYGNGKARRSPNDGIVENFLSEHHITLALLIGNQNFPPICGRTRQKESSGNWNSEKSRHYRHLTESGGFYVLATSFSDLIHLHFFASRYMPPWVGKLCRFRVAGAHKRSAVQRFGFE